VINADEALRRLMEGNARFARNETHNPRRDTVRRAEQAEGQAPFAIIVGCSDSRVPPEVVFDQGIGDLFLVRIAGNTAAAPLVIGSIEFAVTTFGCPLLMVLAHEDCGAVKAAIDAVREGVALPGQLPSVVEPIRGAVARVASGPEDRIPRAAIRQSARDTATQLRTTDSLFTDRVATGDLKVVAAEYLLHSGTVELID
jgi:carbonic anhydrase